MFQGLFIARGVQLSQSGLGVCERVVVLHLDHLHPLLHDRAGVLVLLLVGLQGGASQGGLGGDHPAHNVHQDCLHQQLPTPSCLHKGVSSKKCKLRRWSRVSSGYHSEYK